ncbi:hypothetical protein CLAFUW4_10942 [Fulvia fulva]|uniref:F-box domain-containing protein n=1 Tax=Passalora fulva TaxID=5499 RepID=A0A9Q8URA9_PASFU|nr:uncharacterized protein CLAFUR5_09984 [Fulvia fulva]KAK4620183.1 hypothetical protein CLAFUR4_10947 [Fulvia fulva]KAK4620904.1 hypothetical protein CLAFUR0_10954 [Fulvia fulva]UJO19614.1 hypothetical protein CLAFUR5_09984 [Fulvia fulva]WPV17341.1 hypothetical protein CLAFUW4_10942 [Fulvia fulva]WPV31907.1 hypothetical protein CLAFUW7_10940 [Fulvia fulva]
MAAAKVLAIPELLEMILEKADPIQLFALQRVDRTFHAMILNSKRVRRRMLLETPNAVNDAAVNEILNNPRVKRAIARFEIRSRWFSRRIMLKCPCPEIKAYRTKHHRSMLRYTTMRASWRQIKISSGSDDLIVLHCPNGSEVGRSSVHGKGGIALGTALDQAEFIILRNDGYVHKWCNLGGDGQRRSASGDDFGDGFNGGFGFRR